MSGTIDPHDVPPRERPFGNSLPRFYQRHWRWFVLGTLFLATFLNYFDRQTLGTVAALVGAIETGFTAFVIQRVGFITKETADFGPVFLLLAGLATFAWLVMLVFVKPQWFTVE